MKKFFIALILLSVLSCATALANSMPREEMTVGGIGYGITLGNVKAIYGEPLERRIFDGIDAHGSTWIYSPNFSVTGRTSGSWQAEEDLTVVAFTLKDNSLSTPSGLTVGMNYQEVVKLWGRGELYDFNGRRGYFYVPSNSDVPLTLTFYVDAESTITEIELGTDF